MRPRFRRTRAVLSTSQAKEVRDTALHGLEASTVQRHDAINTATMMKHVGPLIASLKDQKNAVIRIGALLLVKNDGHLVVHQLTAAQQLKLDHQPQLAEEPLTILDVLEVPATPADQTTNGQHLSEPIPSRVLRAATPATSPPAPAQDPPIAVPPVLER
ncbi:MAG TPA: hypothetical protein VGR06_35010 [Actinophytocola sp.]|jgi:hypothetical protein|uniref:hypothetical protein n=1 Tax=Actinophytocola sp. TaxID=1872138 RepID=UPI002E062684|nr:hypothetical protein [Actinophytocola sp.]